MKRQSLAAVAAGFCLTAAVLTGCAGEEPRETTAPSTTEAKKEFATTQAAPEEIDEETMELIKYNIYVDMNNYVIEILDHIDAYYSVVEYQEEFALIPDSGLTYGYGIAGLSTDILEDAAAVAELEPAFETLDELTLQIVEPMRTMMDIFNDLSQSGSGYADNQYAKAKEFHAAIWQNTEAFEVLAYAYLDEIDHMASEQTAKEEQRMLDEGWLIQYNSSRAITITRQILDECYAQEVSDDNLTELDLTNIRPLFDELVAVVEAYHTACDDNDQIIRESLGNSAPFDGLLDSLIQAVEWMIQQVESQAPIEDPSLDPLGSTNHIYKVLSQCIDRYNAVFVEG